MTAEPVKTRTATVEPQSTGNYTMKPQQGRHVHCVGTSLSGKAFDCSSKFQELHVGPQNSCYDYVPTYAEKYGVDADLLTRIIKAESGGNPMAKNNQSTASGCAQFVRDTWSSTLNQMGKEWTSPFNAEANVEAMAFKIANGGISAWNASKHSWGR